VQPHIQYLLFGQFIPKGGFKDPNAGNLKKLKSMKTERLFQERQEELKAKNDD